jgi:hypothetical protein
VERQPVDLDDSVENQEILVHGVLEAAGRPALVELVQERLGAGVGIPAQDLDPGVAMGAGGDKRGAAIVGPRSPREVVGVHLGFRDDLHHVESLSSCR